MLWVNLLHGASILRTSIDGSASLVRSAEVTIGYGVREDWERHAPQKVKVFCSMDGVEFNYLAEGTDFSGMEWHNDAHVPVSGKCLKVRL